MREKLMNLGEKFTEEEVCTEFTRTPAFVIKLLEYGLMPAIEGRDRIGRLSVDVMVMVAYFSGCLRKIVGLYCFSPVLGARGMTGQRSSRRVCVCRHENAAETDASWIGAALFFCLPPGQGLNQLRLRLGGGFSMSVRRASGRPAHLAWLASPLNSMLALALSLKLSWRWRTPTVAG
eukprot:6208897-Pleurochrysis_carterae.AAC.3